MSFDDGLILGLSLASGSDDYKNNDPDYALYKRMPDPEPNQLKVLVRVVAEGVNQKYIDFHQISGTTITAKEEGLVDWGDGTVEGFGYSSGQSHTYAAAGDYIITVTDNSGGKIDSIYCRSYREDKFYYIALKVGENIIYDESGIERSITGSTNFKYIQPCLGYYSTNRKKR